MSRFRKLSHTVWHCQYHIAWVPKYRLRILEGAIAIEVSNRIRAFSEHKGCEVVELNIQIDHVHLIVMVPPKISISDYLGIVKGRTATHTCIVMKPTMFKYSNCVIIFWV